MRDGWVKTTLGEVAVVNPSESALPNDAPFIPMDAVHVGKRWTQYTELRGDRSGARAKSGDILFARITPCLENGKVAQVPKDIERCGGSTEFIVIRGKEKCLNDYLYLWSSHRSTRDHAAQLMTGTTGRQRLSAQDLARMSFLLPPLPEQMRIVDLISSIDFYIEALRQQVQSARKLRNAVLNELITTVYDHWTLSTLGEIADWGSGGTPKADNPNYYGGEILWCVIGDLTESKVFKTEKTITLEGLTNSSAKIISPGSVLLAMYGASIGRTGITAVPMATNQAIAFANPYKKFLTPEFLLLFLQTQKIRFVDSGQGAAQPNISQTIIKSWPILLPSLDEQKNIVNVITSIDSVTNSTLLLIAKTQNLRSSILTELLNGIHEIQISYDKVINAA